MKAWIARDLNGELCVYSSKPFKHNNRIWYCEPCEYIGLTEQDLPEGINPQWSDNEPIEVELTIQ